MKAIAYITVEFEVPDEAKDADFVVTLDGSPYSHIIIWDNKRHIIYEDLSVVAEDFNLQKEVAR